MFKVKIVLWRTEIAVERCDNFAHLEYTSSNTALGWRAGSNLTTGDENIHIGLGVEGVPGESNTIRIGTSIITATFIRGISGATVSCGAGVFVNSSGHLGTLTSSARFKDEDQADGQC